MRFLDCVEKFYNKNTECERIVRPHIADSERKVCVVFCAKKCHSFLKPIHATQSQSNRLAWNEDGAKGKYDPNLVRWLSFEENYSKYHGGKGNGGTKKNQYCTQISELIVSS